MFLLGRTPKDLQNEAQALEVTARKQIILMIFFLKLPLSFKNLLFSIVHITGNVFDVFEGLEPKIGHIKQYADDQPFSLLSAWLKHILYPVADRTV